MESLLSAHAKWSQSRLRSNQCIDVTFGRYRCDDDVPIHHLRKLMEKLQPNSSGCVLMFLSHRWSVSNPALNRQPR